MPVSYTHLDVYKRQLEETGIRQLAALEGIALRRAADELANEIFSNSHVIYAMLFDLQSVDVVRMIEGRE